MQCYTVLPFSVFELEGGMLLGSGKQRKGLLYLSESELFQLKVAIQLDFLEAAAFLFPNRENGYQDATSNILSWALARLACLSFAIPGKERPYEQLKAVSEQMWEELPPLAKAVSMPV